MPQRVWRSKDTFTGSLLDSHFAEARLPLLSVPLYNILHTSWPTGFWMRLPFLPPMPKSGILGLQMLSLHPALYVGSRD